MKYFFIGSIILLLTPSIFARDKKMEIEYKAIEIVADKYNRGLVNRLKGTGFDPSYQAWYENECFVSVSAGTHQNYIWSVLEWFSVNVCSGNAEIIEVDRRR